MRGCAAIGAGSSGGVAVDATGAVSVVLWGSGDVIGARLAEQTGGGWAITSIDPDASASSYLSYVLDPSGTMHVAYLDAEALNVHAFRYARRPACD